MSETTPLNPAQPIVAPTDPLGFNPEVPIPRSNSFTEKVPSYSAGSDPDDLFQLAKNGYVGNEQHEGSPSPKSSIHDTSHGSSSTPDDTSPSPRVNSLGVSPEAPWLGLSSFTEEVRDYFFGRDAEILELFERVQHRTLTVMYGKSGLGKTSLLGAGLMPRLRDAGYTPIPIRLDIQGSTAPLDQQIKAAIFLAAKECNQWVNLRDEPTLWEIFHNPDCGLVSVLGSVSSKGSESRPPNKEFLPVLVFDQFEELFTLGERDRFDDAVAFLEALSCLVENRQTKQVRERAECDDEFADRLSARGITCRVLITLRDDFIHELERARHLMPSMMDNRFELRELRGPQAFEAAYKPGLLGGREIVSRETAEAIVRFVAGRESNVPLDRIENVPPLLSLVCEQLNRKRIVAGQTSIQLDSSTLSNHGSEVLSRFYDNCFLPFPQPVREFVEEELLSDSGYRQPQRLNDSITHLTALGVENADRIIDQLVNQRLLVKEERRRTTWVELTHDSLAPIAASSRSKRRDREAKVEARRIAEASRRRELDDLKQRAGTIAAIIAVASLVVSLIVAAYEWHVAESAGRRSASLEREATSVRESLAKKDLDLESERRKSSHEHALVDALQSEISAIKPRLYQAEDSQRLLREARESYAATSLREVDSILTRPAELAAPNPNRICSTSKQLVVAARAIAYAPDNPFAAASLFQYSIEAGHTSHAFVSDLDLLETSPEYSVSQNGSTLLVLSRNGGSASLFGAMKLSPRKSPVIRTNIAQAALNSDGSRIAIATTDKRLRVFFHDQEVAAADIGKPVSFLRFHLDDTSVVAGCDDGSVWRLRDDEKAPELMNSGPCAEGRVVLLHFSPNGEFLTGIAANHAGILQRIFVIDSEERVMREERSIQSSDSPHDRFRGNHDGSVTTFSSKRGSALVWRIPNLNPEVLPLEGDSPLETIAISPDGSVSSVVDHNRRFMVFVKRDAGWQLKRSEELSDSINSAEFTPDGRRIALAHGSQTSVFDVASNRWIGTVQHPGRVEWIGITNDGMAYVAAERLLLDDWKENKPASKMSLKSRTLPDIRRRDISVRDSRFRKHDFLRDSRGIGHVLARHGEAIEANQGPKASSPQGFFLEPNGQTTTGRIRFTSADGQTEDVSVRMLAETSDIVSAESLSVSADGWRAAARGTTGRGEVIYRAGESFDIWRLPEKLEAVRELTISADGSRVASIGSDGAVYVFEFRQKSGYYSSLSVKLQAKYRSFARKIALNADGRMIATIHEDDTGRSGFSVRVWTVLDWAPISNAIQGVERFNSVVFNSDGTRILTASEDGTARLWHSATGLPVGPPMAHSEPLLKADFSDDELQIRTVCQDGTIHIWDAPPPSPGAVQPLGDRSIADWLAATSSVEVLDSGACRVVSTSLDSVKARVGQLPGEDWRRMASWLTETGSDRLVSWRSRWTVRQVAERERDYASERSHMRDGLDRASFDETRRKALESALQYDPTVPLARMLLANVLEQLESAKPDSDRDRGVFLRAAHWRRYDLDRLPNDPALRKRAAAILRELPDAQVGVGPKPTLAKDEADKLDPPVNP
jgi:WD40 repeat protein